MQNTLHFFNEPKNMHNKKYKMCERMQNLTERYQFDSRLNLASNGSKNSYFTNKKKLPFAHRKFSLQPSHVVVCEKNI